MAGEAVSGRYGAARHAVADEGGPRRPASDDRSLVDRLLAGGGEEHAFDWGWGDPATGELVSDREPLHDIPELWGPDTRSARDSGERDGGEEKPFPTPRLHGENSRADDDHDWSDRSQDDLGSDGWGASGLGVEDRRRDDHGPRGDLGLDRGDRATEEREHGVDDRRFDSAGLDGDPLDALSTGRVHAENGPLGDGTRDREMPDRGQQHDVPVDDDHIGARAGADPLDRSPFAPPLPNRDPFAGEGSGLEALGREPGEDLDRDVRDREQPRRTLFDQDPLNGDRDWPSRDPRPRSGDPADHLPRADDDRFDRDPLERAANDRDPLSPEPPERKLVDVDPRLRRWADRNRPSGPPRIERPAPFADEPAASDPLATDRGGEDRASDPFGPDQFGADLLGSGDRDRPDTALVPHDVDLFADPAESVLTGRINIAQAAGPGPDHPRQEPSSGDPAGRDVLDQGPDPLDVTPDPTTAFPAVAPAAPARRSDPDEPALPLEEYAARRRAAEQAAASAEEAASSAAERASAAIAAAARAAEEAEAAAEAAAKAAQKATEAAEAEVRAIADAVARGEGPGQQESCDDALEPPTQAVPLIAPARAPGRRPPPRRPTGPPPRVARPDEPARSGPPRAAQQNAPLRGGADGEVTAVLTGLDALRDPVRPRRQEQAPAEVTTVTRRRPAAEPARDTDDDADDVDDADHDDADHDDEPEDRGLVSRLTSRPVIAAVGVGAVLVLAAIVAIFTTSEPEAAPPEAAPAAVTAPVAQESQPTAPAVNLHSQKAIAFLTALRDADIPTSSSGQAEVEAADAICSQLDQGADEAQLARSVPAVLPNVTRGQASDVVDYAQQFYC